MSKIINSENLQTYCRTCLEELHEAKYEIKHLQEEVFQVLKQIIGYKSALYPKWICEKCCEQIKTFNEFIVMFKENTKYLDDLVEQNQADFQKTEKTDEAVEETLILQAEDLQCVLNEGVTKVKTSDCEGFEDVFFTSEVKIEDDNFENSNLENIHLAESLSLTNPQVAEIKVESNSEQDAATVRETGHKDTSCRFCGLSYSTVERLKLHMRSHKERGRKRQTSLKLHRGKPPFQCHQCEKSFKQRFRFKRHIEEVHTTNPKEIPCKYGCGKTFRRQETAAAHHYLKHTLPEKGIKPKEKKPVVCEDCGRVCINLSHLKRHSFTHRPAEDRPHKCEQCGKRFILKKDYNEHMLRHAGVKNVECPNCGIKTTTKGDLRQHIRNIHADYTYPCPKCEKVFNHPKKLRNHDRNIHERIKKYKCSHCDKTFGKVFALKRHVIWHTGERPHKCQICECSFKQVAGLKRHMKTHAK